MQVKATIFSVVIIKHGLLLLVFSVGVWVSSLSVIGSSLLRLRVAVPRTGCSIGGGRPTYNL